MIVMHAPTPCRHEPGCPHDCGPCPAVPLHGGSRRLHAIRGSIARPEPTPVADRSHLAPPAPEPVRERCGRWLPVARESCFRLPGHGGKCRSRWAVEYDRDAQRAKAGVA